MPNVSRPHLTYFKPATLSTDERAVCDELNEHMPELFDRDTTVRHPAQRRFVREVASIYAVEPPAIGGSFLHTYYSNGIIYLGRRSLYRFLVAVAQWLNENALGGDDRVSVHEWACSLFYRTQPHTYRKLVRRGRIPGVLAQALYTSDSIRIAREEGINLHSPDAPRVIAAARARGSSLTAAPEPFEGEEEAPVRVDVPNHRSMSRDEVRRYATSLGLTGAHNMRKAEIVQMIDGFFASIQRQDANV